MKNIVKLMLATVAALSIVSCSNHDKFGGDVYSASDAKRAQQLQTGTIIGMQEVKIDATNSGFLGSFGGSIIGWALGDTVGGGKGTSIARAVGSVAGAAVGSTIQNKLDTMKAHQLTIKLDNSNRPPFAVVQKFDKRYYVGQRVQVVGSGDSANIIPLN